MPLPPPPGYQRHRQRKVDRRRILLSSVLASVAASVLMLLVHQASRVPGQPIRPIPLMGALLVISGAAACGAWGEAMRQLALTRLGDPDGPRDI